ncbi:MAG: hypothetical protein Wins2KO_20390 [Winogradskyella sp.]
MNKLWLHTIRAYVRLGLFFYFKSIQVNGLKNIPNNKPIIILCNHQNALLDALIIAAKTHRFSYFLTRASVFKKKNIAKLLRSLQMLPVFRIRDGWSTISKNEVIFHQCSDVLSNNASLAIFPEGNHSLERRVRPLSKGFTRIINDAYDKYPELDLKLIPAGLNYAYATKYPEKVSVNFGPSIDVENYLKGNKVEDSTALKQVVYDEISQLTTNIPQSNYELILSQLNAKKVNWLEPTPINSFITNNSGNFTGNTRQNQSFISKAFKMPLIVGVLPVYVLWKLWILPKIKENEFIGTFRFGVAVTLVPLYLITFSLLLSLSLGATMGFVFILMVLLLALLTAKC